MDIKVAIFEKVIDLLTKQADNTQLLLNQFNELIHQSDNGDPTGEPEIRAIVANISTSIKRGETKLLNIMRMTGHPHYTGDNAIEVVKIMPASLSSDRNTNYEGNLEDIALDNPTSATTQNPSSTTDINIIDDEKIEIKISAAEQRDKIYYKFKYAVARKRTEGYSEPKDIYLTINISNA